MSIIGKCVLKKGTNKMRIEEKALNKLKYIVRYPENYVEGEKYPVILLLHGAGGRGDDIEVLKNNPFFLITNEKKDFPFISVAPLCSANTWFDLFDDLKALVKEIAKASFTDAKKIYAMGASMGGYATWQLAMSIPEFFAAIAPICGGGMYWNVGRLKNVPVWAFHGALDTTVLVEESIKMVRTVKHCGGSAKITIYPENMHDAWSDTYNNPEVYEWFLSHENENAEELVDKFKGSEIYG